MRSWADPKSPWGKQLRFDISEFEAMMDQMRDRAGSQCFTPGRGVDVDLVLLLSVKSEADYVDLPSGMMGRTLFFPDGTVRIEVSRNLADEAESNRTARQRLRSTLAHECGHVACHRELFIGDTETLSLFPAAARKNGAADESSIMCRSEAFEQTGYRGEWWEFQANRCMAALLMPRRLLSASTNKKLADGGFASGEDCVKRGMGELLIRELADEYDVSQTATLYRLQALGFVPDGVQTGMQLAD